MTSCNEKIALYILPQLASIEKNLSKFDVHFYFVYSKIHEKFIDALETQAKKAKNITFYAIKFVQDVEFYECLVKYGSWQWPCEAYYTLRPQDYLPDDVDRILYIDAGDVIINGDISPYYFDDFEGNSIIATAFASTFKTNEITKELELVTREDILKVVLKGIFNGGCYVINVDKFRKDGYSVEDYRYLASTLHENRTNNEMAFIGDQGFLAAAFVGDVKFFGYPENKDPTYNPYNFTSSFWGVHKKEPSYTPIVIHYALPSKPWILRFSEEIIKNVIERPDFIAYCLVTQIPTIAYITPQHFRLCETWWEYAKDTPIYNEANAKAIIYAECFLYYYFTLCEKYNDTALELILYKKKYGSL